MVNENDFNNNSLPKEIQYHEQQHAKQLHSLDILFVELFFCFTWFHPIIYFLKKELKITHEFLADEFVIRQNVMPKDYQNLILHTTNKYQTQFVNNFNYLTTKKRFIMMTKSISRRKSSVLQISTSVFLLLFALMSMLIPAQKKSNVIAKKSEASKQTAKAKEVKANLPTKVKAEIAKKNKSKDKGSKEDKMKNVTEAVPQEFAVNSHNQIDPKYKEAEYANGQNEFRKLFAENFDTSKINIPTGTIKTLVKLDIDEQGNVKDIYAEGSNETFNYEAVSAITKIVSKNKFIPAQQDGVNVSSKFKFPITMNFE